ncbi:MAG: hypothetical protein IPN76_23030 [Saprospiraceae bacterium]|jgi:hypothetical protein|nr:hypothetical protein [Saprospiraceae bacterium]
MAITSEQLEQFRENSLNVSNAISLANQISSDLTVNGIFPNGDKGDFSNPDTKKFNEKWCKVWRVLRVLFEFAKTFTNENGDKAIDALIALGNTVCKPDNA